MAIFARHRRRWSVALVAGLSLALVDATCRGFDEIAPVLVDSADDLPTPTAPAPPIVNGPVFDPSTTFADEEPPIFAPETRGDGPDDGARLIDRVTDPTEWLQEHRFRQSWNRPLQSDIDRQEFEYRATVPFRAWDHVNILRVTIPFNIEGDDGHGLKEVRVFDLVVFEEEWGRWGVGPDVEFLPANDSDEATFRLGPAAGAVAKNEHWTLGILNQNYFADNYAQSRWQPIVAYKFNDEWALTAGQFEFNYNWQAGEWTQVPLGLQLECIADLGGQKLQLFANPQYNFIRDASNSGWTLFLGLSLLAPDA